MQMPPPTIYQQLRQFFPALVRSDRLIHQDSDSLAIWLKESADRSTLDAFHVEFAEPPVEPPRALCQTIQTWLPDEIPAIESLLDKLTDGGRAAPLKHKSKKFTKWFITASVHHNSITIRFDASGRGGI